MCSRNDYVRVLISGDFVAARSMRQLQRRTKENAS